MQITPNEKNPQSFRGPGPSCNLGPQLQLNTTPLQENGTESPRISLLINSVYYFIETVFILETAEGYRLIAIHQGKLWADETYKTPKGAKIAYRKLFGHKAWEDGVIPNWTPFYPPEKDVGPLKILAEIVKNNER